MIDPANSRSMPIDKQEVEPTLEALQQVAEPLGKADALLSDNGYYSEANVKACAAANITPYIAAGRERHHLPVCWRSCKSELF